MEVTKLEERRKVQGKQAQQRALPGMPGPTPAKPPHSVRRMHEPPAQVDSLLLKILAWRRKHDTYSERAFRDWLLTTCVELTRDIKDATVSLKTSLKQVVVTVPMDDGKRSDVLFSSHIDTQDHKPLPTKLPDAADFGVNQPLIYDTSFGHIALDNKPAEGMPEPGGCLGADDGIGVWIMLNMIAAGVPGSYVFHRGEECGGLGANAMLVEEREWLKEHNAAIAFDRPRYDEVIITQGGSSCASTKFGDALAKAINDADPEKVFDFKRSHNGVFTDTKVYRGVIAECVNIGVGYEGQHGSNEFQDYGHACALLKACLAIAWHSLPIDREPSLGYGGGYGGAWDDDHWGGRDFESSKSWKGQYYDPQRKEWVHGTPPSSKAAPKPAKGASKPVSLEPDLTAAQELDGMSLFDIEQFAKDDPYAVAVLTARLLADLAGAEARISTLNRLLEN